jgi:eukaryotic-like serine/threonine-protein kinase
VREASDDEVTEVTKVLGTPSRLRYELLERIGSGASGAVYRAREVGAAFTRDVCVKRLSRARLSELAIRELWEEGRLLARVHHANVASFLAVGLEGDRTPFLVLELVRGPNLRALCRSIVAAGLAPPRAYLPERVAAHVACCILRGLGAVQRALPGVVHRDVSPSNILLSGEGEVKLTDFGIALATDRGRWTRPTLVKGKLGYVSPEQARGAPLDARADLFGVGVVLYELLTRRRPWRARGPVDELRAIERGDLEPLRNVRPDLDFGLAHAVERLLELRAHDRYACADDALRALAPYSAGDLGSLRISQLLRDARRDAPAREAR